MGRSACDAEEGDGEDEEPARAAAEAVFDTEEGRCDEGWSEEDDLEDGDGGARIEVCHDRKLIGSMEADEVKGECLRCSISGL